jgi:hypothetical protein
LPDNRKGSTRFPIDKRADSLLLRRPRLAGQGDHELHGGVNRGLRKSLDGAAEDGFFFARRGDHQGSRRLGPAKLLKGTDGVEANTTVLSFISQDCAERPDRCNQLRLADGQHRRSPGTEWRVLVGYNLSNLSWAAFDLIDAKASAAE